jgi:hypothetical protein
LQLERRGLASRHLHFGSRSSVSGLQKIESSHLGLSFFIVPLIGHFLSPSFR